MTEHVVLDATDRQFASWRGIAVLADAIAAPSWVIAGGQMVALRLQLAALEFPRVTVDADAVVDVRAHPGGAEVAASALVRAGWIPFWGRQCHPPVQFERRRCHRSSRS